MDTICKVSETHPRLGSVTYAQGELASCSVSAWQVWELEHLPILGCSKAQPKAGMILHKGLVVRGA